MRHRGATLVVPHMMRELPFAIGLFAQNVQEYSFVRRLGGLAVLHRGPRDPRRCPTRLRFSPSPAMFLRRYKPIFVTRVAGASGGKPELVQSFFGQWRGLSP